MSDRDPGHKGLTGSTPALTFAELSDVGRTRDENQDALGHRLDEDVALFLVCDGMGGHAGGSTASTMAVDRTLGEFAAGVGSPARERLDKAIEAANTAVYEKSRVRGPLKGMGTTLVAIAIALDRPVAQIAHVGDSRAYLLRPDKLVRLTRDHSMVQILVDDGILSEDEAAGHPHANVISRSLGSASRVEVDHEEDLHLEEGDCFLLCSDGLSGRVREAEMARLLWDLPEAEAARALVDLANERGGNDNISVQIVRVGRRSEGALPEPLPIIHPPPRSSRRADVEATQTGGKVLDVKSMASALAETDPTPSRDERYPKGQPAPPATSPEAADQHAAAKPKAGPSAAASAERAPQNAAADAPESAAGPPPALSPSRSNTVRVLPVLLVGIAIGLLAFLAIYLAVTRLEL